MEYFRYDLTFLNTLNFTSSEEQELDAFLNGVVKKYLNHNYSFLNAFPTQEELNALKLDIEFSYDLMLDDIKPRYLEALRLGTQQKFTSKDVTDSEYGDEERTGKYFEPVVSSSQAEVKTNGEVTSWEDDKVTLEREEYRVLSESAIKDFFKEIKEEVESYFIDFINIYADGKPCERKSPTQAQLNAINSGITAEKVEQIETNKSNIETLTGVVDGVITAVENKQDKLDEAQLNAVNSGIDSEKVSQIETNKNNIAQLSNPNLLINGDFRVNQRGQTNYTGNNTYTADRWQQGSGSFDYSTKTWTPTTQYSGFVQKIEDFEKIKGKTITLSIYINSCSTSGVFDLLINDGSNHRTGTPIASGFSGVKTFTYTVPQSATQLRIGLIYLGTSTTDNISIDWVKAEIGDIATPFSPRPYVEELVMCQRYYQRFNTGDNYSEYALGFLASKTSAMFQFPLTQTLRTTPTVIVSDNTDFSVRFGNQSDGTLLQIATTNIAIRNAKQNNVFLTASWTTELSVNYSVATLRSKVSTSYIAFDSEIY